MATLDDLFGNTSNGPRIPSATSKLQNPGDQLVGVIVGDARVTPETNFTTRKPKFMVETGGGKKGWEVRDEGDFDTSLNNFALTQIEVVVKTEEGQQYRHYISGEHKDALKDAMQDSELPLDDGVTLAAKVLDKKGNRRKLVYKLAQ